MTVSSSERFRERPRRRLGTVDDVLTVLPLARSSLFVSGETLPRAGDFTMHEHHESP